MSNETNKGIEIVTRYNGLLTTTIPDGELHQAIASARSEMPHIEKNSVAKIGNKYSFKYADLAAIFAATTPTLSRFGLSVTQPILSDGSTKILVTRISHGATGQFIETVRTLPAGNTSARESAGDETFWRRYSLNSLIGIHPADDVDCLYQAESHNKPTNPDPFMVEQAKPKPKPRKNSRKNSRSSAGDTVTQAEKTEKKETATLPRFTKEIEALGINFPGYMAMRDVVGYTDVTKTTGTSGNAAAFQRASILARLRREGLELWVLRELSPKAIPDPGEPGQELSETAGTAMFEALQLARRRAESAYETAIAAGAVTTEAQRMVETVGDLNSCTDLSLICKAHDCLSVQH